jgi:hypothetical protein
MAAEKKIGSKKKFIPKKMAAQRNVSHSRFSITF